MEVEKTELKRNWILAALMMTMILAAMDNTIVATAIPQIVGDLGGFSLFSWLFSIYLLVQTITIPLYGKLADLLGRKPIIIYGIIVFLVGSAACGFAWNMPSLIAFRGIQAVGAGAIMATVNTIAGDIYTIEERAKIQGWLSSVWGISAILGPAIGGFLADYVSWRWIFFINIPFGLLSIGLIVKFLKEGKSAKQPKIDWAGAISMLITAFLIMYTLLESGKSWPWLSYTMLGYLSASVLLIIVTIRIERKAVEPILPVWVWKKRVTLGSNLATIGMGMILMGPSMYLPVFAQSVTGVGAIAAGFILASMSITWPVSSALSGKLYLRIGFRNTALCGITIVGIGTFSFLFIQFPGPAWSLVAIQMLMGAGFGLISTPLLVGVQSTVEYAQRGVVTGANIFSRYFGQSLGAALFAVVFNYGLNSKMEAAPQELKTNLPSVNELVDVMQSKETGAELQFFLRETFFDATQFVYAGISIMALVTILILLWTPAKFPSIKN
ncbi:MDR family MFS transporter [Brumimicrobium oceani]|uniref:MFS transporter n=1 Tax=Brumimicrobium oceani TaxID=2100725 RepID=A0A2U2XF65_9FLAO|nr:MDR family MFS transporter [Brumimicrobium oceani]PWH86434.1 MFS transporter [Brumimicrobium oceani]